MSRLAEELRIDVSALYPERGSEEGAKGRSEKYRSKRFVLLNSPKSPVTNSDEKELFEESRIGLGISRIDDWREEELEVLRRLWALRDEWGRYG